MTACSKKALSGSFWQETFTPRHVVATPIAYPVMQKCDLGLRNTPLNGDR